MSRAEVLADLDVAEDKIEAAASALVPVMTGTTSDPTEIAKAVHDALNLLASARLHTGLAAAVLETEVVTS